MRIYSPPYLAHSKTPYAHSRALSRTKRILALKARTAHRFAEGGGAERSNPPPPVSEKEVVISAQSAHSDGVDRRRTQRGVHCDWGSTCYLGSDTSLTSLTAHPVMPRLLLCWTLW